MLVMGMMIPVCVVFMWMVYKVGGWMTALSVKSFNEVAKDKTPVSKVEMRKKLLELNSEEVPFGIIEEQGIFKVRWKLADASWYGLLKKENYSQEYELQIYLVDGGEARLIEVRRTKIRVLGLTGFELNWGYHRGWQAMAIQYKKVWAIKQLFPFEAGKVLDLKYNAQSFREPILKLLVDNGWRLKPVGLSLRWGI